MVSNHQCGKAFIWYAKKNADFCETTPDVIMWQMKSVISVEMERSAPDQLSVWCIVIWFLDIRVPDQNFARPTKTILASAKAIFVSFAVGIHSSDSFVVVFNEGCRKNKVDLSSVPSCFFGKSAPKRNVYITLCSLMDLPRIPCNRVRRVPFKSICMSLLLGIVGVSATTWVDKSTPRK